MIRQFLLDDRGKGNVYKTRWQSMEQVDKVFLPEEVLFENDEHSLLVVRTDFAPVIVYWDTKKTKFNLEEIDV